MPQSDRSVPFKLFFLKGVMEMSLLALWNAINRPQTNGHMSNQWLVADMPLDW